MQRAGELGRKLRVRHRRWRSRIDGAGKPRRRDRMRNQANEIVALNPAHPLPARANRATKTELRQLAKALTAARRAIKSGNSGAIGAANENFHDELIKLAHNDLLAATLEPLQGRLHWLFRQHADPTALNQEHQRLFDAVASGNPERAAAEALNHVQVNRARAEHFLFGANAAAKSQLSDNAG